ncbi:16S rRNA (guanine(527)-N(7))-methyltransferase RsmG [Pseudorhodoplanes sinuspersici]|uniref:Ribosomal RNA small subunit methyltransferase G n=1 Tax=Pseudorhodoplanes sinuspersici TaxID=1235591 RepID=A0A1W6ZNV8_9HYPH|nr:16S rRNA (guanine(527)-N(7))-methyltransferase RsmG [Pseudorhodoplanes sinuspersici]ARP99051.1 16S rRNA (guanine(527)-N(7))-methyltransferase RsmG [Pseudorhodoplanes sinuspersici]RKE69303.1 16S rRNA (guanine527-N7)-methyltransferase [Pseudorhodoplanes sinuspersici]
MAKAKHQKTSRDLEASLAADRTKVIESLNDSREIAPRLDRYVAALLQWQATTNLIAPSTIPELWSRHIADSLQLLRLAPDATRWVDLGSGGGFPGLVIACALADKPRAVVHLVESNLKKAAFLREAVRLTGASARVHAVRIEDFVDGFNEPVEIVTARALASLDNLLDKAYPLLKRGAQALFLKGQDVEGELTAASKYWTMDTELIPSITDAGGRIVRVVSAQRLVPPPSDG